MPTLSNVNGGIGADCVAAKRVLGRGRLQWWATGKQLQLTHVQAKIEVGGKAVWTGKVKNNTKDGIRGTQDAEGGNACLTKTGAGASKTGGATDRHVEGKFELLPRTGNALYLNDRPENGQKKDNQHPLFCKSAECPLFGAKPANQDK